MIASSITICCTRGSRPVTPAWPAASTIASTRAQRWRRSTGNIRRRHDGADDESGGPVGGVEPAPVSESVAASSSVDERHHRGRKLILDELVRNTDADTEDLHLGKKSTHGSHGRRRAGNGAGPPEGQTAHQ